MKTIINACLISISFLCQAQKIEVLIIGTVHHFEEEYKSLQNFEKVQRDIVSYDPDIICIEAIPTDDTLSLREILPRNMKRADSLKRELASGKYNSISTQRQLQGAHYFSRYDFWNAYFHWDSLGKSDQTPGPFSRYHRSLGNSEYGNIVFPAARRLGIEEFQNIDYRYGEMVFLENNNKVTKKLLLNLKFKPLGSYVKIQKRYKKANKAGSLIEFVNSREFQGSFSSLIDELPSILPKSTEAKSVKEAWHKRNKIMAERIYQAAISNKAERALLTVGAAHVSHIKHYLEQQGCSVITYGEVLEQQSKLN